MRRLIARERRAARYRQAAGVRPRSAIGQTPKLCRGSHLTCQMIGSLEAGFIGYGGRYEYQHQCRALASAWAVPLRSTKPCPWRVVATPSFAQRVGESRRLHVARYRLVAPRSRIRRIKAHLDELTNQGLQFGVVRFAPLRFAAVMTVDAGGQIARPAITRQSTRAVRMSDGP